MKIPAVARGSIIILACAALAIALYIMVEVDAHRALPGCGADACGRVLNSRWEKWGGLSVSTLGVGGYVALIAAALVTALDRFDRLRRLVWSLMVVEGLAGLGFVAWLILLQWLVIRHFCIFCLSSHVFGVAAYVVVIRWAPVWKEWRRPRLALGGSAGVILSVLIGVHILIVPEMMVAQAADDMELAGPAETDAASGGLMQFGKQAKSRTVQLLNESLSFDLYKVPVTGSREAPYVLVELSDYCCPSCRNLHAKLHRYREKTGIDLAVVQLLAPMNEACNPNATKTPSGFEDSCTYAQLSMAVNKADQSKFEEYHNYLMDGGWPPKVDEARAKAVALVGQGPLDEALASSEVEDWINTGIGVQGYIKAKTLPRLITPDQVISYSGGSRAAFAIMMRRALGLEAKD